MRKKRHIFSGLAFGGLCMASMAIAGAAVSSDPVSSEASVSPELYGAVIASDNPEFSDWGIYRIPVAGNGDFIRVATGSEVRFSLKRRWHCRSSKPWPRKRCGDIRHIYFSPIFRVLRYGICAGLFL